MAYIDATSKQLAGAAATDDVTYLQKSLDEDLPLNTPWTFWIDRTDIRGLSAEDYERNLKQIYTVDTVQKFWQVFNNIPSVDELGCNYSYHLMREQYRPVREDAIHQNGGAWRIKCYHEDTKQLWKELLLAAIGEQLTDPEDPTELLGVSVALKDREDMMQLWHANANAAPHSQVVKRLRQILPPSASIHSLFYKAHHSIGTHHSNGSGGGGFPSTTHHNNNRMF